MQRVNGGLNPAGPFYAVGGRKEIVPELNANLNISIDDNGSLHESISTNPLIEWSNALTLQLVCFEQTKKKYMTMTIKKISTLGRWRNFLPGIREITHDTCLARSEIAPRPHYFPSGHG